MYYLTSVLSVLSDTQLIATITSSRLSHDIAATYLAYDDPYLECLRLQLEMADNELIRRLEITGNLNHPNQKFLTN